MLLTLLEARVPALAAGSGLITFNQLATSHRRVGSILVEVLRQRHLHTADQLEGGVLIRSVR